jgi:hypothetical protein
MHVYTHRTFMQIFTQAVSPAKSSYVNRGFGMMNQVLPLVTSCVPTSSYIYLQSDSILHYACCVISCGKCSSKSVVAASPIMGKT